MEKPFTQEQRDVIAEKSRFCKTGVCGLWREIAFAFDQNLDVSQGTVDYIDQGIPTDQAEQVLFVQRLYTHIELLGVRGEPLAARSDVGRVAAKLLPFALTSERYDNSEQKELSLQHGVLVKTFALYCEQRRLAGKATMLEHTASMLWSGFREEVRDAYPAWYTVGPSYGPAAPKGILAAQSAALSDCLQYLFAVREGKQELTTEGLEALWVFNWYPVARQELLDVLFSIYEKENM